MFISWMVFRLSSLFKLFRYDVCLFVGPYTFPQLWDKYYFYPYIKKFGCSKNKLLTLNWFSWKEINVNNTLWTLRYFVLWIMAPSNNPKFISNNNHWTCYKNLCNFLQGCGSRGLLSRWMFSLGSCFKIGFWLVIISFQREL